MSAQMGTSVVASGFFLPVGPLSPAGTQPDSITFLLKIQPEGLLSSWPQGVEKGVPEDVLSVCQHCLSGSPGAVMLAALFPALVK